LGLLILRLKAWLKRFKFVEFVYQVLFRKRPKKVIVLSVDDVHLMVDDWCHSLPTDFDCVVGVPRGGLMVACDIALNLAVSLSVPELFVQGVVWQSHSLNKVKVFKRVLVVEDAIYEGKLLFSWVEKFRELFPDCVFECASLVVCNDLVLKKLDYFYCFERSGLFTNWGLLADRFVVFDSLPEL
jgi:hypothetical protein